MGYCQETPIECGRQCKKSATDPTPSTNHNPTKSNSNAKWFIC